MTEYNLKDCLF